MSKLKYQSSRLFNGLTVVILSLLCVLLNYLTRIDFHRLELPKNKPAYLATGIVANMYNSQGLLMYRMQAESARQFPDSSRISLNTVTMQVFSESDGLMLDQLTSNDGWLDNVSNRGFLGQNVVVSILNKDPQQTVNIYTKEVKLNGITRYAASSAPVRVTQGKSVLTGIGFTADYEKKFLTIESQVKVVYAQ